MTPNPILEVMMGPGSRRWLLAISTAALVTRPAAALNLLPNAAFDSDVSGWLGGFAQWSIEDAAGSAQSGSLELQNTDVLGATVAYVCVPVQGGASYSYGGEYLIDSGQMASGQISIELRWYSDPSCSQFLFLVNPTLDASVVGAWSSLSASADAPVAAQGAQFSFFDMKQGAPSQDALVVHLDNAFLPEPDAGALQLCAVLSLGALRRRGSA